MVHRLHIQDKSGCAECSAQIYTRQKWVCRVGTPHVQLQALIQKYCFTTQERGSKFNTILLLKLNNVLNTQDRIQEKAII